MSKYQPIPFSPFFYFRQGEKARLFVVLWLFICLLVIPSGMLTRIFELTGIPVNFLGLDLHITVYVPMLLCVPLALIFGYFWAAIPAYFSTVLVAILGDMPFYWIVVFALANPIGLAMMVMIYRIIPANINLRSKSAFLVFVVTSFLSALSSSIGSFIWTYTNQVDLHDFFRVWQGWWLGGFLQAVLICAPFLFLFADKLMVWRNQFIFDFEVKIDTRRSIKAAIILITIVLIAFTWLAFKVSMMNVQDQVSLVVNSNTRSLLNESIEVVDFPIMIYVVILAFIGYFAFTFIDYWTLRLEKVNKVLQEKNERLYQLSIKDNLTRQFNRGYLFSHLPQLISSLKTKNQCITIMLIDLDHFKAVNDTFGHQAGDQVLKQFSDVVKNNIESDQVFARFGGEEFILVSPGLNQNDALACAQDIIDLAKDMAVEWKGQEVKITISIGVYVTYQLSQSVDYMIDQADKALYKAKRNGRDQVFMMREKSD